MGEGHATSAPAADPFAKMMANLGIPSSDQIAAEAAQSAEWRDAMLDQARRTGDALEALVGLVTGLREDMLALAGRLPSFQLARSRAGSRT